MKYDASTIKRVVSCRDLLALNGIETDRKGKARCIFHDDKHASMHIYSSGFKCFACGAHGDVIDIACRVYGLDFNAACSMLSDMYGIAPSQSDEWRRIRAEQDRKRREHADRVEKLRSVYFGTVQLFRHAESEVSRYAPDSTDAMPSEQFFRALDRLNAVRDDLTRAEWALHEVERGEAAR